MKEGVGRGRGSGKGKREWEGEEGVGGGRGSGRGKREWEGEEQVETERKSEERRRKEKVMREEEKGEIHVPSEIVTRGGELPLQSKSQTMLACQSTLANTVINYISKFNVLNSSKEKVSHWMQNMITKSTSALLSLFMCTHIIFWV